MGFTTSLGFSKKLDRIRRDPRVALASHSRERGFAHSRRYVLAQGHARVVEAPTPDQRVEIEALATRFLGEGRAECSGTAGCGSTTTFRCLYACRSSGS